MSLPSLSCTLLRQTPRSSSFRRDVIERIWGIVIGPISFEEQREVHEAYFYHVYQEICKAACTGDGNTSLRTHGEVLEIVKKLGFERFRKIILKRLPEAIDSTGLVTERVIKLAASLFLPLNINGAGGVRRGFAVTWMPDQSLEDLLHKMLPTPESSISNQICTSCSSKTTFPKSFSAKSLEYIAGFDIVWTSNLLDHLLLVDTDDKTSVYIYHQVNFLERTRHASPSIIPEELISETIDTLSLLLPRYDRNVRKWFRKLQKDHKLDPGAITSKYLKFSEREIDHFHFWKDRLIKLKCAFDEHEPKGPLQWWRDDRRSVQWWTFWVAALVLFLTVFFGLIQTVTGILQVLR